MESKARDSRVRTANPNQEQQAWSIGWRFVHLFALNGFAVAQPLYALLAPNPTFFVAHHASTAQVLALVTMVSLGVPVLLTLLLWCVQKVSWRYERWCYQVITGLLLTLALLPLAQRWVNADAMVIVLLALIPALAFVLLQGRFWALSLFLSALSIAALAFPLSFLSTPSVRQLMTGPETEQDFGNNNGTPVVMIVFDELPLTALLTPDLSVNRLRYPGFAALADTAHWFRNASTVSSFTEQAVPTLLTGNYPPRNAGNGEELPIPAPVPANYPRNLFSLLARTHEVRAIESITGLAPASARNPMYSRLDMRQRQTLFWLDTGIVYANIVVPEGLWPGLPRVNGQWLDFADLGGRWAASQQGSLDERANLVLEFINTIDPGSRPPLYFLHVVLPHVPLVFLPSGKYYGPQPFYPHGLNQETWEDDSWAATQGYQRFLFQVGYVDRLLGNIVARLKDQGLYDDALLIVTADHGQSYREGTAPRMVTGNNLPDTLLVPLFIKLPHQEAGTVSDRNVQTIDIMPTIAAVLDSDAAWTFDGQDLFSEHAAPAAKTVFTPSGEVHSFDAMLDGLAAAVQRKYELFGSGDWDEVYRVGPAQSLHGLQLNSLSLGGPAPFSVSVERGVAFQDYRPDGPFIPALLRGQIKPAGMEAQQLAIALNGTLAASTWSFSQDGTAGLFTATLPEALFREGFNRLDVLQITSGASGLVLHPATIEQQERSIALDQVLGFRREDYIPGYLVGGLAAPEPGHSWSNAPFVQFEFKLPPGSTDIHLHAMLAPYLVEDRISEQPVEVLVNGESLGTWVLDSPLVTGHTVAIPQSAIDGGNFLLEFRLPLAAAPYDLGIGEDRRLLAVRFISLRFSAASP